MLLALDVGNTHTVFGLHDGHKWVGQWRMRTQRSMTVDEVAVRLTSVLSLDGYKLEKVDALGTASVVPQMTATLTELSRRRIGVEPVTVNSATAGIQIGYLTPQTLGADRIANAVAGYHAYGQALIVVDFGTATTFDYVSSQGRFEGGIIAPGLMVTGEALFQKTAQLPQVDVLRGVDSVVARDTVSAMTVGLFEGYIGLVERLIAKLKEEVGTEPLVLATGGLAAILADRCPSLEKVDPNLTLEGIRLVLENNVAIS